jgi:hypothetical protein
LYDGQQDDDDDYENEYIFGQVIHILYRKGADPDTGLLDTF